MGKVGAQIVVAIGVIALGVAVTIYAKYRSRAPDADAAPGEKRAPGGGEREIVLLSGGSFRPPTEKLAKAFEDETGIRVTLSFGQSEELLPQIKVGKQGDAFLSHDPYAEYVAKAGALSRYVVVGFVAPVLVVRKGNPKGVKSLEDLARTDLRVCLPDPKYSTCGEMLQKLLKKKGMWEAVEKNAGNAIFRSHAQTCNALALDHRDLGVSWNGVAHSFGNAIEIVPTPYEYDTEVRVTLVGLNYSKNGDLLEKFLSFAEKRGKPVFEEFGYAK